MEMGSVDRLFIDTNILIYASVKESPFHTIAIEKIESLMKGDIELWINFQVLREYIAVLSQPNIWSQPILHSELIQDILFFRNHFTVAEENTIVFDNIIYIIKRYNIQGKKIYDSNIVATMITQNIPNLLTHNTKDFLKFSDLITIIPLI